MEEHSLTEGRTTETTAMARKFTMKKVLRMTSNLMLETFFEHLEAPLLCIDWSTLGEHRVDPMLVAIGWHPREKQDEIEAALRIVHDLACTAGMQSLYDVARARGIPDLAERLPEGATLWERAMSAWMWDPALCEEAALLHHADGLSYWRRRLGLPCIDPRSDEGSLKRFGDEISEMLRREQGRGRHCSVEHYRRNGTDFYFVYPDDYARTLNLHDEDGDLTPWVLRSTFEMIFAFERVDGTLDVNARIPKKLREQCEESFGREILGRDLPGEVDPRAYDVDRLRHEGFRFRTDPVDRVHFTVEELKFDLRGTERAVTVGVDPNREPGGILAAIRETLRDDVLVDVARVRATKLRVDCSPHGGRRWHLRIGMTPTHCTIRTDRPDRAAIIHKNLRLSGLVHV